MGKIALLSQGAKLNIPNLIYWEMLLCFLYIAACKEQFKYGKACSDCHGFPISDRMLRMQQMVCPLTERPLQIGPVQCLNIRILMEKPNLKPGVQLPELIIPCNCKRCKLLALMDGLASASGTTAGAGHYLRKVIRGLSRCLSSPSIPWCCAGR